MLDALIPGDDPGDLLADRLRAGKTHLLRQLGTHARGELAEDLPLGSRFADARPRNLRAIDHPPLGRGLGDAAGNFVASHGGQKQHRLATLGEHLRRERDVHVNAQGDALQRLVDARRIRHHLAEVAADGKKDVEVARLRRVERFGEGEPRLARHRKAIVRRERSGVLGRNRQAARQRRGVRPHLGAALHARVAADRHHSAAFSPHEALAERQIEDGVDGRFGVRVLRHPHPPDEDHLLGLREQLGVGGHLVPREAAQALEHPEVHPLERRAQLVEPCRVRLDEARVQPALLEHHLQNAVHKGPVPSRLHLEETVADARAKKRALQVRRDPVRVHPRLAVGADGHDLRPCLLGVVEVLHHHRLVVGDVRADETYQVGADQIAVRAGRRRYPEGRLEREGAGRVADARGVVEVVAPHGPHGLLHRVVGLVGDAATGQIEVAPRGSGRAETLGDERERLVPRDALEPGLALAAQQRVREASQRAQLAGAQLSQGSHVRKEPHVQGGHGVEPQEAQADVAKVHALDRPVR